MQDQCTKPAYTEIFIFWIPLAATWLMMAVEGPYLSALIARLAEPKYNLAAYGISLALALLVEAPVVMFMSASTALSRNYESFIKVRRFAWAINFFVTASMALMIIPQVFDYITARVIGVPETVAALVYKSLIIMLPWPAAIGVRRFYNGIMIRYNRTRFVAYGTMIRLFVLTCTGMGLYLFTRLPGALIGAAGLTGGVLVETVVTRLMVIGIIRDMKEKSGSRTETGPPPTYGRITGFYLPLALTTMLVLGSMSIINTFVGGSRMPLESLAVLPVINALLFIFNSFGLSYHEVGIALMDEKYENHRRLRNFSIFVGVTTSLILLVIGLTEGSALWFHHVSGLSLELTEFARLPIVILTLVPLLTSVGSYQRAVLVNDGKTSPIIYATALEVGVLVAVLVLTVYRLNWIGATAAALALALGRFFSVAYLYPSYWKILRRAGQIT